MVLPVHILMEKEGFISLATDEIPIGICRDANINVFRDKKSGVIYTDPDFMGQSNSYYYQKTVQSFAYPRNDMDWADALRRHSYLAPCISGKHWLDFGCGPGYQLRKSATLASAHLGVEINNGNRQELQKDGFSVSMDLSQLSEFSPQVISLFHVIEHLPDPVGILEEMFQATDEDCLILIEVPHARDTLLLTPSDAFKKFTLWSEHLVLHTRDSLRCVVEKAGWIVCEIVGVQRYPVWNHMAWLIEEKPTGLSAVINNSSSLQLQAAYENYLATRDLTDTLLLYAKKRGIDK